ncbi:hypothetical protein DB313_05585 (plasmid) [Borrelia turcica IST7]|uniref:Lipoprotein n=1 Tax=Borrelia turcica IST7 TaxID=1104446 RepID=A0A386PP38_9SPIR|nr:hypothetical protein [Borrelia turcica]AYE36968.1 hypothetical protein DB313_05585 [Borrelia turcica IST7]
MKVMIKSLMIISLVGSVMSCRLYDKLLDVAEESLDKQEVSMESHDKPETDATTSEQNSGRSGRRARSLSDDSEIEKEEIGSNKDISYNQAKQILAVAGDKGVKLYDSSALNDDKVSDLKKLTNEAKKINVEVDACIVEVDEIVNELSKINTRFSVMKIEIMAIEGAFKEAKKNLERLDKQLLFKLDQAIDKVNNKIKKAELIRYKDANNAVKYAGEDFERTKREADDALKRIGSGDTSWYWYYFPRAQRALYDAKNLLEIAKKDKSGLDSEMKQVEKDFDKLKQAHEDWSRNKTL